MVVCVFADASDRYWSGVVTQTSEYQLSLPIEEQRHEPLAFQGSAFKGAELGWSTFEKEGYAIFQTFEKVDYFFFGSTPARIFSDHRNLLFVFVPIALEPRLGRHIISKVQRWALFLSRFEYVIEHVGGIDDVFADILTRWVCGYRKEPKALKTICSLMITSAKQLVPSPDSFVWPSLEAIGKAQERSPGAKDGLQLDRSDRLWKKGSSIWISTEDVDLQVKLIVVSHCVSIGHRGCDATESIVREKFWWSSLSQDVAELVRGCLHCLISSAGEPVSRPLSHAFHGSRLNEVLHVDFSYMGAGTDGKKYILILRDDLSSYVWLWPTESATSEAAAEALAVWFGCFGSIEWIISNQGSHFKNELIKGLTDQFRVSHHFTTAYTPWANGTVERVCREVLRAYRALQSEWRLTPQDWPV